MADHPRLEPIRLPDIRCWHGMCELRTGPSQFARRCVCGGWMRVKVSPDFRYVLGTDQTASPSLQTELQRRTPTIAFAKYRDGNCVCAADWLSVEGNAGAIRVGQRHPRVLSRMGSTRSIRKAVATCSGRVRRVKGN